jgi:hypothetical protein
MPMIWIFYGTIAVVVLILLLVASTGSEEPVILAQAHPCKWASGMVLGTLLGTLLLTLIRAWQGDPIRDTLSRSNTHRVIMLVCSGAAAAVLSLLKRDRR